jgi:hypothetical protein
MAVVRLYQLTKVSYQEKAKAAAALRCSPALKMACFA